MTEHKELVGLFQSATVAASELIPIEEVPNQELATILHISQVMLARAQEQGLAAIELFLSGHWAAFEALSRISLEYSVRYSSLMKGDPRIRFGQYLGGHFREMENRQRLMHDALVEAGDQHAIGELEQARLALKLRQDIVSGYAEFCGFALSRDGGKPSSLDLFKTMDKSCLYRGLYSVLSSQVHADAESLVDYIIIHCVQRTDEEKDIAAQEAYHWMLHYLVNLIGAYIEACENFASCFLLTDVSRQLLEIRSKFRNLEKSYSEKFYEFKCNVQYS